MKMKQNFPIEWDEERVRKVIAHYEGQTELEAAAEDEAAFKQQNRTFMEIASGIISVVRELIARFQQNHNRFKHERLVAG